jgi:hypothetical protein
MKIFYGAESPGDLLIHQNDIFDRDEDFIIVTNRDTFSDQHDFHLLLNIKPSRTTFHFEDYGFLSEKGSYYLFYDMISMFFILDGDKQEMNMFLLQLEEELIAVENQEKPLYILSKHNLQLVKKWAKSYNIKIEFILE